MSRISVAVAGALLCLGASTPAIAFDVDTNVDGLSARFDNTIRYSLGTRVNSRDQRFANDPNYDETEYRFDKGDVIVNRLDLLSEVELDWKKTFGARVSGSAWYDQAYDDTRVKQNPALAGVPASYASGQYSSYTKRYYRGPSGELLDAFVYANLDLGGTPLNVKVGKHVTYWGAALFSQGGIAYSQHPIDARKAVSSPGTEVRETFLPLSQISAQTQILPSLSLSAQYYLDWAHVRAPEGGTFYGATDFTLDGPTQLPAAAFPNGVNGCPIAVCYFSLQRDPALGPAHNAGNWGVNARWTVPGLDATAVGLYYRKFDEKLQPWLFLDSATSYRAVFPRGTRLIGVSAEGTVGDLSVGAEVSTRRDAGLNSLALTAVTTDGARGNTWHALVNTIYSLPTSAFFPTSIFVAELTFDHLEKVTRNAALYNDADNAAVCPLGKYSGCATRNAYGFALKFTPTYPQVYPGVDVSVPVSLSGGLHGNTADFGGTTQKTYVYSAGLQFDVQKRWLIDLLWADQSSKIIADGTSHLTGGPTFIGNAPNFSANDRGAVTLSVRTSF